MVSKVMAGADTLRASGTVVKKLARWLAEHNYVRTEDMALAIEQGADAARNLPAAEKLSALLYDLTAGRHEPHGSDIEGRFSITNVAPGRIWPQDDDDGKDYGPILLAEKATKLCRVGWRGCGTRAFSTPLAIAATRTTAIESEPATAVTRALCGVSVLSANRSIRF
jgi:hypothetical protein